MSTINHDLPPALRCGGDPLDTVSFEQWCKRLNELSARQPERYGPNAIENCGDDAWRPYFEDGYTPEEAWREDGSYE